jgi:DNA polymerase
MTQSSQTNRLDAAEIAGQAAALVRHLQAGGVGFLPKSDVAAVNKWTEQMQARQLAAAAAPAIKHTRAAEQPVRQSPPSLLKDGSESYPDEPLSDDQRLTKLEVLQQQVSQCTRCPQLVKCRTMTVFGEGSVRPRVAFFGEGPGADEDRTGRPFVGKAGQLLTKMIEACKMQREDVYILNTVKCRPPGNRNPEPEEVSNCREYFEQQLEVLRPEYIVCLGAVASQALLKSKLAVGRLRGEFHRYFDSKVVVTYHPAYLLRNPAAKKAAWQDLQLMLRDAGLM